MSLLKLAKHGDIQGEIKKLPSSKSISNRALILDALSGNQSIIHNLSSSSDTQQMEAWMYPSEKKIKAIEAGTAMRFLTAYFTVAGQNKILRGTATMNRRPIGHLVEALKVLGGDISYLGVSGFSPLEIHSFTERGVYEVALPGSTSSQFISALMMVAPRLKKGLTIKIEGEVKSKPYIYMTASLMEQFGASCLFADKYIQVPSQPYRPAEIVVEPDWSSISYYLAITALAKKATLTFPGVSPHTIQGDWIIVDIMGRLGVETVFRGGDMILNKKAEVVEALEWDFSDCPDLAQTVLPVCALKGVTGKFYGMGTLRIKETDRIVALQTELAKVGAKLHEESYEVFTLQPSTQTHSGGTMRIATYNDHRMAMGFSPWATVMNLEIENPGVVKKSYPQFWHHLESLGFSISQLPT